MHDCGGADVQNEPVRNCDCCEINQKSLSPYKIAKKDAFAGRLFSPFCMAYSVHKTHSQVSQHSQNLG